MDGEKNDSDSDGMRVLVERLRHLHDDLQALKAEVKNGNEKIDDHANETRRQWENHNSEHREIDKTRIKTIESLKDGNHRFNTLDSHIESVRKERSRISYFALGLMVPIIGALWYMRGTIDEKADARLTQEIIERKANINDVKEIKDDIREIRAILSINRK